MVTITVQGKATQIFGGPTAQFKTQVSYRRWRHNRELVTSAPTPHYAPYIDVLVDFPGKNAQLALSIVPHRIPELMEALQLALDHYQATNPLTKEPMGR